MTRTLVGLLLAFTLCGCSWLRAPNTGPFAKNKKTPPPPYGSVQPDATARGPQSNQSPLGIAFAEPTPPLPPDDPSLVPPKAEIKLAGATEPSAPQPAPVAPKAEAPKSAAALKELLATAKGAWAKVTTYEAVLTRREINPRGDPVRDTVLFHYRREPMALYTYTIDGNSKGRESVYNPSKFGDTIHLKLGEGDHPIIKPGFLTTLSPDDKKVVEKARYSVREIGHGKMLARLEAANKSDALALEENVTRPEWPTPLARVTHRLARGDDPVMPGGGTRLYFFDTKPGSPSFGLPVLVTATDATGKEVEFYLFEKWKNPANLTDADFDPARLKRK